MTTDTHTQTTAAPVVDPSLQMLLQMLNSGAAQNLLNTLSSGAGLAPLIKQFVSQSALKPEQRALLDGLLAQTVNTEAAEVMDLEPRPVSAQQGRALWHEHDADADDDDNLGHDGHDDECNDPGNYGCHPATHRTSNHTNNDISNNDRRSNTGITSQHADQRELRDLRQVNDTMAAALGACRVCWGGWRGCDVCGGRGQAGYREPDLELFDELVAPALKRVLAMRRANRSEFVRHRR